MLMGTTLFCKSHLLVLKTASTLLILRKRKSPTANQAIAPLIKMHNSSAVSTKCLRRLTNKLLASGQTTLQVNKK